VERSDLLSRGSNSLDSSVGVYNKPLAVNAYVYFFIPPLLLFVLPALAFLVAAMTAKHIA